MNAASEYAAHQHEYDEAMRRIAEEVFAWADQWDADVAAAAAQVRAEVAAHKPRLLDLYCGAGGAARGYQQAGFYVVGVDIAPQPRYAGDEFIQGDALEYAAAHGHEFDAIHASPECEGYSHLTPKKYRGNHALQIGDVRALLQQLGKPYVIENVANARRELNNPLMLCGSMFGLKIWRHRYFEIEPPIYFAPASCCHDFRPIPVNSSSAARTANTAECREGLQMPWAKRDEIRKAIPPAYTQFIGQHLRSVVQAKLDARTQPRVGEGA